LKRSRTNPVVLDLTTTDQRPLRKLPKAQRERLARAARELPAQLDAWMEGLEISRRPIVEVDRDARLGRTVRQNKRRASANASALRRVATSSRDDRIRGHAAKYRTRHAYDRSNHSTRALAQHVALQLRENFETVRTRLRVLGIR
jgi:hypothetical protein